MSGGDPSDGELIERCGHGDRDAFELLYDRYVRTVFGLALRRLGDRASAEDAVQETFAAVWRSARSYRPERGQGSSWFFSVARNAITDRGRARKDIPMDIPETISDAPGPHDRTETAWVQWRVHRALEELPEHEGEVVALAYWRGLSQREIADRLGIPLGTVKTRTRSALARLAAILDGEDV